MSDKPSVTLVDKNGKALALGDVITGSVRDGYSDMTITAVFPDGTVDTLRVYVSIGDFTYVARDDGSRVIATLGYEEIKGINPKHYALVRKNTIPLR